MTLKQLRAFAARIDALHPDLRDAVRVLFHNPTDATPGVYELFAERDALEGLHSLLDTAREFGVEHADLILGLVMAFEHDDDDEASAPDPEACPSCGCRPGDGVTPGCQDANGCGFNREAGQQ